MTTNSAEELADAVSLAAVRMPESEKTMEYLLHESQRALANKAVQLLHEAGWRYVRHTDENSLFVRLRW